jgi:hypothetical protein
MCSKYIEDLQAHASQITSNNATLIIYRNCFEYINRPPGVYFSIQTLYQEYSEHTGVYPEQPEQHRPAGCHTPRSHIQSSIYTPSHNPHDQSILEALTCDSTIHLFILTPKKDRRFQKPFTQKRRYMQPPFHPFHQMRHLPQYFNNFCPPLTSTPSLAKLHQRSLMLITSYVPSSWTGIVI